MLHVGIALGVHYEVGTRPSRTSPVVLSRACHFHLVSCKFKMARISEDGRVETRIKSNPWFACRRPAKASLHDSMTRVLWACRSVVVSLR